MEHTPIFWLVFLFVIILLLVGLFALLAVGRRGRGHGPDTTGRQDRLDDHRG